MTDAQEFRITKESLRAINAEAKQALDEIAARYRLSVTLTKSRYGDSYFDSTFSFAKERGGKFCRVVRALRVRARKSVKPTITSVICRNCGHVDRSTATHAGTSVLLRCGDCCDSMLPYAVLCRYCCPSNHGTFTPEPRPEQKADPC